MACLALQKFSSVCDALLHICNSDNLLAFGCFKCCGVNETQICLLSCSTALDMYNMN